MIESLKREAGYSLVEVMASIVILTVAILPMVGIFDLGLRTATTGSKYDSARALANANVEKVKALRYKDAVATYRPVNATPAGSEVPCNAGIYVCRVRTTYVNNSFNPDPASRNQIRIDVTVTWDASKAYTTTGFRSSGGST